MKCYELPKEMPVAVLAAGAKEAVIHFRAPHHTVSIAGMAGEVALSSGGVLFLDEVHLFALVSIEYASSLVEKMHTPPIVIVRGEARDGIDARPCTTYEIEDAIRARQPDTQAREKEIRWAQIATVDHWAIVQRQKDASLHQWYSNPPPEVPQALADNCIEMAQYHLGRRDAFADLVELMERLEAERRQADKPRT